MKIYKITIYVYLFFINIFIFSMSKYCKYQDNYQMYEDYENYIKHINFLKSIDNQDLSDSESSYLNFSISDSLSSDYSNSEDFYPESTSQDNIIENLNNQNKDIIGYQAFDIKKKSEKKEICFYFIGKISLTLVLPVIFIILYKLKNKEKKEALKKADNKERFIYFHNHR